MLKNLIRKGEKKEKAFHQSQKIQINEKLCDSVVVFWLGKGW